MNHFNTNLKILQSKRDSCRKFSASHRPTMAKRKNPAGWLVTSP
jgi:hypothetical protein